MPVVPSRVAPPLAAGGRVTLRTTDFDELARSLTIWNATFRQMSAGTFAGTLTAVQIGGVKLSRMTLSHTVQFRGGMRQPGYLFTPVIRGNSRAVWRGNNLRAGCFVATLL